MTVSNIAAGVQTPNIMGIAGNVVGIANAGQQYQIGQQMLAQQDIKTEQMQQAWGEKQAIRDWFSKNPQAVKSDGTLDMSLVSPAIAQLAPLTGREQLQDMAATNTAQTQANTSIYGLDLDKIRTVKSAFGDMLNSPLSEVTKRLNNLKQDVPEVGPQVDISLDQLSHIDPQDPEAQTKVNALVNHARSIATTLEGRKTLGTPTLLQTGSDIKNIAPSGSTPYTQGQNVAEAELPPGAREEIGVDPIRQAPIIVTKNAQGRIIGTRDLAATGGAPAPQPNPANPAKPALGSPLRPAGGATPIPAGESAATAAQFSKIREDTNAAAAEAPTVAFNNKQVLDLLNSGTTTGSGAESARKVFGSLGLEWSNDEGKNLATIQHYLAQNQQAAVRQMGVHTDLGREDASNVTGGIGMPTETLKGAVKANDSLTSGLVGYNQGMENAVKNGGSIFAIRQYRTDWGNNFDPTVFRYQNALRDGDKREQAAIESRPDFPRIMQKAAVLHNLIVNGRAQ